jgi:hypothetical protein
VPTGTFDIASYTVAARQFGATSEGSSRRITLAGTVLTHGIQHDASIYFREAGIENLGVVSNVDQPNFEGHHITAIIRMEDFEDWYDLLRSESPLRLLYSYEGRDFDPERPRRRLEVIQLFTGLPELPGEGPAEALLIPSPT